jgi:predicted nucleic acid-binding protein
MIVADTNVVASLLIHSDLSTKAEALRAKDHDWHVPSLFVHEWLNVVTLNVMTAKFERDEGLRVFRRGLAMVKVASSLPDPLRVLNLHLSSGCSSYDCQFVDLAQQLRVALYTSDREVLRSFPDVAAALKSA